MNARASRREIRGGSAQLLAVASAVILGVCALMLTLAPQARAVERAGPTDPQNGYPLWYEDSTGLRLDLCVDGPPLCLEGLPDPTQPGVVAADPANSNFPEEAFWWQGEASIDRPVGNRALLVLAREAAFGGADEGVRDGDQVSFSRVRIRIDGLVAGETYTIRHPYGTDTFVAEPSDQNGGVINFTGDIGCALSPNPASPGCDFGDALFGRVDPFLTWDPSVGPAPPRGYVGDPNIEHRVVGSPVTDSAGNPQNYFQITGPNAGGPGVNSVRTDLFSIQGKISGPPISLEAATSPIDFGRATTLRGTLTDNGGNPLAGKGVIIQQRAAGATRFTRADEMPAANLTTGANGNFSLRVSPDANTDYRARFVGDRTNNLQPSTSFIERVNVRAIVTQTISRGTLPLGQSLAISGRIRPPHTATVSVRIERGGQIVARRNVQANPGYRLVFTPANLGTYTVSTRFRGDSDHLPDVSRTQSFTVTR